MKNYSQVSKVSTDESCYLMRKQKNCAIVFAVNIADLFDSTQLPYALKTMVICLSSYSTLNALNVFDFGIPSAHT